MITFRLTVLVAAWVMKFYEKNSIQETFFVGEFRRAR